jgi:hypothetical protein
MSPMDDRAIGGGGALAERDSVRREKRPGLGTGFGERVNSPVEEVVFYRQNPVNPAVILGLRYNDRSGLIAMGVDVDGEGDHLSRHLPAPQRRAVRDAPPLRRSARWLAVLARLKFSLRAPKTDARRRRRYRRAEERRSASRQRSP